MTAAVQLRGVDKQYGRERPVHVLTHVDLEIQHGEMVSIVGPSGSGKSTLLHIIGTLERPSAGSVQIAGIEAATLSDRALSSLRAHRVGFVFQDFCLLEGVSVLQNVAEGLLYHAVPHSQRTAQARDALERVGLGHRLEHHPAQLSGGEKQRVAIARALVGEPTLILADEPTGNLDTRSSEAIIELLSGLNREQVTIAVVTHDHGIAAATTRRIELRDGRIVGGSGADR
jgi:putative ABC transport system ATP-binding protein